MANDLSIAGSKLGDSVFVHIGKSAGSSTLAALRRSKYKIDKYVHIRKPPVSRDNRYLLTLRSPISRAVSAFNWRYKLVVETGEQMGRFPGEFEVLKHYSSISRLAEKLYRDCGAPNPRVHGHFNSIFHLGERIEFYLDPLVYEISEKHLIGVITQENFDQDILDILGTSLRHKKKFNQRKKIIKIDSCLIVRTRI